MILVAVILLWLFSASVCKAIVIAGIPAPLLDEVVEEGKALYTVVTEQHDLYMKCASDQGIMIGFRLNRSLEAEVARTAAAQQVVADKLTAARAAEAQCAASRANVVAYLERYQKASFPIVFNDSACADSSADRLAVTSLAGNGGSTKSAVKLSNDRYANETAGYFDVLFAQIAARRAYDAAYLRNKTASTRATIARAQERAAAALVRMRDKVAASVGPVHAEFNLTVPCASLGICELGTVNGMSYYNDAKAKMSESYASAKDSYARMQARARARARACTCMCARARVRVHASVCVCPCVRGACARALARVCAVLYARVFASAEKTPESYTSASDAPARRSGSSCTRAESVRSWPTAKGSSTRSRRSSSTSQTT